MAVKLKDLEDIAKAYCKKMGYEYIFANDYKFGFEDKNGNLWTMTYFELESKLKGDGKDEGNKI